MLGIVHDGGELWHFGPDLVGHGAPLGAGGLGGVLGKGYGNEGRDDPPPAFPGMGKGIALEVNPAPLPGGAENLRDGGLDSFVRVRDHQLHAPQATPGQLAQELGPDRLGLRCAYFQAQHLAPAVGVHADGDDDGDRDDPPAAPDREIGRIDPEAGPSTAPIVHWTVGNSVQWTEFMRIDPSSGRVRKAFTLPSISSHRRLTWLLLIPDIPIALTRSSTDRVEMPWTWASWITAVSAFSAMRCSSR